MVAQVPQSALHANFQIRSVITCNLFPFKPFEELGFRAKFLQKEPIISKIILVQVNSDKACLTISPKGNLHEALTTASSFLSLNAGVDYVVLVTDEVDFKDLERKYPAINFISADFLGEETFNNMNGIYSKLEFAYASTPFAIKHLLSNFYKQILFLKLETLVLGDLNPLFNELDLSSAIVTPHLLLPKASSTNMRQELDVLMAGTYNGGVVGFRDTHDALTFLTWWGQKTVNQCFRDVSNGLHFEQRWLDFILSLIPDVGVIRNRGINVAHWNLHERPINIVNGCYFVGADQCLVFRFSGFDIRNPAHLSKYKPDLSETDLGDAVSIFRMYKKLLDQHKTLLGI